MNKYFLALSLAFSLCLVGGNVQAIEINGELEELSEQPVSADKFLHAKLVSITDKKIQTSAGLHMLSDATQVVDRRTDTNQDGQVSMRFRGKTLVEVTIYP